MKATHRQNLIATAFVGALAVLIHTAAPARAATLDERPLVLVRGSVTNTLYQPQLDSWDYLTLTAHAANSTVADANLPPGGEPLVKADHILLVPRPK